MLLQTPSKKKKTASKLLWRRFAHENKNFEVRASKNGKPSNLQKETHTK